MLLNFAYSLTSNRGWNDNNNFATWCVVFAYICQLGLGQQLRKSFPCSLFTSKHHHHNKLPLPGQTMIYYRIFLAHNHKNSLKTCTWFSFCYTRSVHVITLVTTVILGMLMCLCLLKEYKMCLCLLKEYKM